MKRRELLGLSAAAVAALSGVSPARAAATLKLYHDKYFWQDFFKKMAAFAAGQGHPFDPTPYATDQYQAFIAAGIQAGTPPELFTWWNGTKLAELVEADALAPMDPLWQAMIAAGEAQQSVADLLKVDGKIYALPLAVNYWAVAYNKALFAKAGVAPPKTWADLMDICAKLKAAGITPFNATIQDGWRGFIWFEELLIRTDPDAYAKLNAGQIAYTSEPVKKVFQIWGDLYAKGYFTPATSNEEFLDFARGKAAMYLIGDWAYVNLRQDGLQPGSGFEAFIMPNITPGLPPSIIVEAAPLVISKKGAQNPDVMSFAKWWMSTPAATEWAKDASLSIGNPKVPAPNAVVAQLQETVARDHVKTITRYWEASPSDIVLPAVEQFNKFMVNPTPAVATACMASIERTARNYWSSKK
ncbi:MAG TPA: extracellular solute-binding protein [Acetobacteraceae bacterium]|nr:extracellular solute-binding protein [Acetobacteraceae bacterium]